MNARCGDDLTGDKSSLGNRSFKKKIKVNAMLVFAVIVGEQDTRKAVNAMLVFTVIVGEKDTRKAVNVVLVFAVIVGEQDTRKAVNVVLER